MTVVAGTKVSALVDNGRVGCDEAATVSVGTERADHAQDDSRCRTDNAREVPGSGGVVDVDKELAPAVACAVSRLLQRVGVRGGWLRNMLQINSMNSTEMKFRTRSNKCEQPADEVVAEDGSATW
jgi:hypothetical protein